MSPAKIIIQGNYWDCQIYRGRLYLFTIEGTIKVIDWNKLIESLKIEDLIVLALNYAFKNGRELYNNDYNDLLHDNEIRSVLENKFSVLSNKELVITEAEIKNSLLGVQDTPFKELHTDSEVSSNTLFSLTHNSLLSASIHRPGLKFPVSTKTTKHFDLYGFTLKANKYARLAVSAGDDGLMEYNAAFHSDANQMSKIDERRMRIVSNRHSSFSDYSFLSIYNTSLTGQSFLAYHKWDENKNLAQPERIKKDEISETNIFKDIAQRNSYLSWGYNEKIYRAVDGGFEIVRFNNYAKGDEPIFSDSKFIALQPWKGKVLSATTAYFGTILHCEHAVVVIQSDETIHTIPGDISRVRIFPRSINYENHLHIIYDDKLEILSFNNDYFVDQRNKDFGVAFRNPKRYFAWGRHKKEFVPDEKYFKIDELNEDINEFPNEDLPF